VPKTRACLQLEERNRIKRGTLFYHHVRSLRRNRSWRRINLCVPKIRFCNRRKPARCQRTSVFRVNDHHGLEDRRTPTIKLDEQQAIAVRELDGLISHRNPTGQSRRLISMFLILLLSPPGLDVASYLGCVQGIGDGYGRCLRSTSDQRHVGLAFGLPRPTYQ
jgi:hypothetical protein